MIENYLRPKMEAPPHPPYHQGEYLEEYFYSFYLNNKNEFDKTGYSLIPIFWSNITANVYVHHTNQDIQETVQTYLDTLPAAKYFAVSQHDESPFGNLPEGTVSFAAGGNTGGIPLPLICSPIPVLDVEREKDIFCSFVGSNTHSIRETLFRHCMHDSVFHIKHKEEWSIDVSDTERMYFIDITTRSKFSLCPRGAAPTSFRMYEILQLNSIPVIVYDKKWLPFEDVIDYASFCVLVHEKEIPYLKNILDQISDNQQCKMLQKGKEVYAKYFTLEGMCNQILQILKKKNSMIHFITYGSRNRVAARERLFLQAKQCEWFDSVEAYGEEHLSVHFKEQFANVLSRERLGGYGIWKPHLIQKRLNEIADGDFLIYADAGCTLNQKGKQRFNEYIAMLDASEYGVLSFALCAEFSDKVWTTKEIFEYFSVDRESLIGNSGMHESGFMLIQNNAHAKKLIGAWMQSLYDRPRLWTDDYNSGQANYFCENRHDQSFFSMVCKMHGTAVLDSETYTPPFGSGESLRYPFWATRVGNPGAEKHRGINMSKLREMYDDNPNRYTSDKGRLYLGYAHTFIDYYGELFDPLRDKYRRILEVGVQSGGSLRLWVDYFFKSRVVGLDIDPACTKHVEDKISVYIGDSTQSEFVNKALQTHTFDFIVDDGSHDPSDQLKTFHNLYPHVVKGGIYIIENVWDWASSSLAAVLKNHVDLEIEDRCHIDGQHDDILFVCRKPI